MLKREVKKLIKAATLIYVVVPIPSGHSLTVQVSGAALFRAIDGYNEDTVIPVKTEVLEKGGIMITVGFANWVNGLVTDLTPAA